MTDVEEKRKKLIASLTELVGAEKANQMLNKIDRNINEAVLAVTEVLVKKENEHAN